MEMDDSTEEQYKAAALYESRLEGCRCDPDVEVEIIEGPGGLRALQVTVIHEDKCPWLMIAAAPWN